MLGAMQLARPRLGRGAGQGRPARAVPPERARRPLPRRARRAAPSRSSPTTATAPPRRSTRAARRPAPRCRGTTASAASSPTSRSRRSRPRAGSRWCGSGCPTARSPGTTWSAARSPSRPQYVPDFALCRANGDPLYTLVNPVDDALMEITHVLRGEDLLSSTPRQIPLHRALVELGIATVVPEFGHLPLVMGEGNKKLSKRDPRGAPVHVPRRRLPARGAAQLPGPARLGDRGRTATSSRSRRWSRRSTSRT